MGLTEYGHIATEETQLRVADLLQAIAAGSAGPEYTDATFKALLDDTNTTEIFSAWWPLSAASNDSKYKRLLRFFTMLQTDKTYTVKFPSLPCPQTRRAPRRTILQERARQPWQPTAQTRKTGRRKTA